MTVTVDFNNIKFVLVQYHTCLKYYSTALLNCKILLSSLSVGIKGHLPVLNALHGPKHLTVCSLPFQPISNNILRPYVK